MKKFFCGFVCALFAVCGCTAQPAGASAEPEMMPGKVSFKIENGSVTEWKLQGYADMAARRPAAKNTIYWIASISKTVTAVAFMQLVEAGKVKLDDPVAKYLPYMKHMYKKANGRIVPVKTPITLRHLLSHSSGLEFLPGAGVLGPDLSCLTLETQAHGYAGSLLLYEPGTGFQYSNAGLSTIGRVIEVVSGMDCERYMRKFIFDPLEMHDTGFRLNKEQLTRVIQGYEYDFKLKAWKAVQNPFMKVLPLDSPDRHAECGGGLYSTPEDFSHFVLMIANGGEYKGKRIISQESLLEMCRQHSPKGGRVYGLGSDGKGVVSHGGCGGSGYSAKPGSGKGGAVFCNVYSKWPDKSMPSGNLVGSGMPEKKQ